MKTSAKHFGLVVGA